MKQTTHCTVLKASLAALTLAAFSARADLHCTMHYTMHGWSAFYKEGSGRGSTSCSDGSSMTVALSTKGGGLTFGKTTIDDGLGEFSGVRNIRDILGDYATGSAHGAAGQAASVAGLTKGEVSLSLKGNGRGIDAGVDVGKFTISEVSTPQAAAPSPATSAEPAVDSAPPPPDTPPASPPPSP